MAHISNNLEHLSFCSKQFLKISLNPKSTALSKVYCNKLEKWLTICLQSGRKRGVAAQKDAAQEGLYCNKIEV